MQKSLSERVERMENILAHAGIGMEEFVGDLRQKPQETFDRIMSDRATDKAPAVAPTAFEEIIGRIHCSTERVCGSAHRLEIIGNRIMGTLPEAGEDAGYDMGREPDGTLDAVFRALTTLDGSLARLSTATTRLEGI